MKIAMRRYSQQVFQRFNQQYIEPQINFFQAVDAIDNATILGSFSKVAADDLAAHSSALMDARSAAKSFVVHQLLNRDQHSGIGCGFYDEDGTADGGGIHNAMRDYLLGVCFDPNRGQGLAQAQAFADYCWRQLDNQRIDTLGNHSVASARQILTRPLGAEALKAFWATHGNRIQSLLQPSGSPEVLDLRRDDLRISEALIFAALDALCSDASPVASS